MSVLLTCFVWLSTGCLAQACYRMTDSDHYIMNIDEETETFDVACFIKGKRVELGEHVVDRKHCRKCDCVIGGLECCGYGSHGGVTNMEIPEGCKVVHKRCFHKIVKIDDEKKLCETNDLKKKTLS